MIGVPELIVDPPDLLNDFVSVGEFNTDGELEGWASNSITLSAVNGAFEVTTTGGDPHFFRNGIPDTTPELTQVEWRIKESGLVGPLARILSGKPVPRRALKLVCPNM